MAYIVSRPGGRWEVRESSATAAGPRSSTLASFRTLTPEVMARARARAEEPLSEEQLRRAAGRAGAPIARHAADEAAERLLAELASGRPPRKGLRRLLAFALDPLDQAPSDAERSAAAWIGVSLQQRGDALRDLLELADRLPVPTRSVTPAFPRLDSSRDE